MSRELENLRKEMNGKWYELKVASEATPYIKANMRRALADYEYAKDAYDNAKRNP